MIGQVKTISKGGRGIVFTQEKPVFLEGVIENEIVEFSIKEKKHSLWTGLVKKIIQASPDRVIPPCSVYSNCGGCNFQHIAYPKQLSIKRDILTNNLKKISRLVDLPAIHSVNSPPFQYRTKTVFKIQEGKIGFLKRRSHQIVEIKQCLLVTEPVNRLLKDLNRSPMIKKIMNGEILVLSNGQSVSALLKSGHTRKYLVKDREILFLAGNFSFRVIPENFIQANRFTLDSLMELVKNNLKKDTFDHSLDLFSGIGFFSLPLSKYSKQLTAVENDPRNLDSLKKNLKENKINNIHILKANIKNCHLPPAELVLVDPPRTGMSPSIIKEITRNKGKKILYFSCDSATFSRDISHFAETGHHIKELAIIDNFPQTDHFEIFAWLDERYSK